MTIRAFPGTESSKLANGRNYSSLARCRSLFCWAASPLVVAVVFLGIVRSASLQVQAQDLAPIADLESEMVNVPGGRFRMGNLSGAGNDTEKPNHTVTISAFKLGKYEVTHAQWDACVADGGCGGWQRDEAGWGRGNRPIFNVSWKDVQGFIKWLNARTGGQYRLPTEAEWEYAARAGSDTAYHFGDDEAQLCLYANHADLDTDYPWRNTACSDGVDKRTAEVGQYQPNAFGLYDMHGNVQEWTEDCWHENYSGAPSDGSAWTDDKECKQRVVRGGGWYGYPLALRSAARKPFPHRLRINGGVGFRLAHDL